MKILFTGGGTGGHFYPLIAVAEEINKLTAEEKLIPAKLYYASTETYNERLLHNNNIDFIQIPAGKKRTYRSFKNVTDIFKTLLGSMKALGKVFMLYPDVIFSKGGFASIPTVLAARILRIPIVIHESDTVPGRANKWAGKFATHIALTFPEAATFFPKDKTAHTGTPIRQALRAEKPKSHNAYNEFGFDPNLPVILILGGSQGAERINDALIDALPRLIKNYQILHQTGKNNYEEVMKESELVIGMNPQKSHYHPVDYFDTDMMRKAADIASIIVSRSGSSALSEIALWGVPAILIPITESNGDHQRKNAFAYARLGAASVIEEANLSSNILVSEIEHLMEDPDKRDKMKIATERFVHSDAARKIAEELLRIALKHD